MASNNVTNVQVGSSVPAGEDLTVRVSSSGRSTETWTFAGVVPDDNGYAQVAVSCGSNLSASCRLNGNRNGGIFSAGSNGTYAFLTTNSKDTNNWTVMVSTDKDPPGTGMTFVAGTGGGGA